MDKRALNKRDPRGILGSVVELDVWLHVAMAVLTAASAARYLIGHGLTGRGPVILLGATALLAVYFAMATRPDDHSPAAAYGWSGALIVCWLALVVLAPSFAWVAVPLAFVALRLLPVKWASAAIITMLITVIVAWSVMQGKVDTTVIAGPLAVAALAITAYPTQSSSTYATTAADSLGRKSRPPTDEDEASQELKAAPNCSAGS